MRTAHTQSVTAGDPPRSRGRTRNHATTAAVTTRPLQPPATSPRSRRPVIRHTRESTSCPPSSGSPGRRLKPASRRLTQANPHTTLCPRPGPTTDSSDEGDPGEREVRERARPRRSPPTARAWCPGRRRPCDPPTGRRRCGARGCRSDRAAAAWAASWTRTATSRPSGVDGTDEVCRGPELGARRPDDEDEHGGEQRASWRRCRSGCRRPGRRRGRGCAGSRVGRWAAARSCEDPTARVRTRAAAPSAAAAYLTPARRPGHARAGADTLPHQGPP